MAMLAIASRPGVLIVEGDRLTAQDLAETVQDIGLLVDGPYASANAALAALGDGDAAPTCALIDTRDAGDEMLALTQALEAANVQCIFHAAADDLAQIRRLYPEAFACARPCPPGTLIGLLRQAVDCAEA